MSNHSINKAESALLGSEIELLMQERQHLLRVAGAAAVLVANLDIKDLPQDQAAIDAAEILGESLNTLTEETLRDALHLVQAKRD